MNRYDIELTNDPNDKPMPRCVCCGEAHEDHVEVIINNEKALICAEPSIYEPMEDD